MIEPGHGVVYGLDSLDSRQRRPAQHDHRQRKRPRCRNLAVCGRAAAVFGDDDIDAMLLEHRAFVSFSERTAAGDVDSVGHPERGHDRLDATHQIVVLRRARKWLDFLAAEGKKDAARSAAQRLHGARHIGNLDPAISRDRRPAGATQRKQSNSRPQCGSSRVHGNRGRVRMRRIDKNIYFLVEKVIRQALGATKTADPHWNRLRRRGSGAACERECDREIRPPSEAFSELPRLRSAAENEDSHVAC